MDLDYESEVDDVTFINFCERRLRFSSGCANDPSSVESATSQSQPAYTATHAYRKRHLHPIETMQKDNDDRYIDKKSRLDECIITVSPLSDSDIEALLAHDDLDIGDLASVTQQTSQESEGALVDDMEIPPETNMFMPSTQQIQDSFLMSSVNEPGNDRDNSSIIDLNGDDTECDESDEDELLRTLPLREQAIALPGHEAIPYKLVPQEIGYFRCPRDVRDYQRETICSALLNNTLIILPPGTGMTYIASVVMMNWLQWITKAGKILYMAESSESLGEQIRGCLKLTGISTNELGVVVGAKRKSIWESSRILFSTYACALNDIRNGEASGKEISCVIVDGAHKVTSDCASVIENIYRQHDNTDNFRVIGLTSRLEEIVGIIESVVRTLHISKLAYRTHIDEGIEFLSKYTVRDVKYGPTAEGYRMIYLLNRACEYQYDFLKINDVQLPDDPDELTTAELDRLMHETTDWRHKYYLRVIRACVELKQCLIMYGIPPFYEKMQILKKENTSAGKANATRKGEKAPRRWLKRWVENGSLDECGKRAQNCSNWGTSMHQELNKILWDHFRPMSGQRGIIFLEDTVAAKALCDSLEKGLSTETTPGLLVKGDDKNDEIIEEYCQGNLNLLVSSVFGGSLFRKLGCLSGIDLIICLGSCRQTLPRELKAKLRSHNGVLYNFVVEDRRRSEQRNIIHSQLTPTACKDAVSFLEDVALMEGRKLFPDDVEPECRLEEGLLRATTEPKDKSAEVLLREIKEEQVARLKVLRRGSTVQKIASKTSSRDKGQTSIYRLFTVSGPSLKRRDKLAKSHK